MKACEKCGRENIDAAYFCAFCGAVFEKMSAEEAEKRKGQDERERNPIAGSTSESASAASQEPLKDDSFERETDVLRTEGGETYAAEAEGAEEVVLPQKKVKTVAWLAVLAVIVVVILLAAAIGEVTERHRYDGLDAGAWEESVYTNGFFDFTYKLPADWMRLSDEELAAEYEEYGTGNIKELGGVLFEAYNAPTPEAAGVLLTVMVVNQESDEWTADDILDFWASQNKEQAYENNYLYLADPRGMSGYVTISGKRFAALCEEISVADGGNTYTQRIYSHVYQEGKYSLGIMLYVYDSSVSEEDVDGMLAQFSVPKTPQ